MAWMLQPKNYTQAIRPNLHNMAYRRIGAYKGMGLISSSNFYVPQVNLPGSMASFVRPASISVPLPLAGMKGLRGLGQTMTPQEVKAWNAYIGADPTNGPTMTPQEVAAYNAYIGPDPTNVSMSNLLAWVLGAGLLLVLIGDRRR
jgi:hypothetical protein